MIDKLMQVVSGERAADDADVVEAVQESIESQALRHVVPPKRPRLRNGRNKHSAIRLAFIGETVGKHEVAAGAPFAGPAGAELRRWCAEVGVDFEEAYLDNVYPVPYADELSPEMRDRLVADCLQRLAEVPGKNKVVVLLGNEALTMLGGAYTGSGIMKHRGSVYRAGTYTLVPMLNPAAVLRNTQWRRRSIFDMQKVKRILDEGYTDPKLHHVLVRKKGEGYFTVQDAWSELWNLALSPHYPMAIDIETAGLDNCITCIGFSISPSKSITFEWPDDTEDDPRCESIRKIVKALCMTPSAKILHNGLYDAWWLKKYAGIELNNWQWDTMCMAQAWYAADNLSLEYLTSILTDIPYYKEEGKAHFKHRPQSGEALTQLMTYCGRDAIATLRCWYALRPALARVGRLKWYRENYIPKYGINLDLMLQGLRIDNKLRGQTRDVLLGEAVGTRDALAAYNDGEPLFSFKSQRERKVWETIQRGVGPAFLLADKRHKEADIEKDIQSLADKTVSSAKLKTLLYDKMGLPVQLKRRAGGVETPTSDNLTLRKFLVENQKSADPVLKDVLTLAIQHAKAHKLAEQCYDNRVDKDGRMYFSLGFTTETGRFSSSKAPNGTGGNAQNMARDPRIRSQVLPEEGHVLLKIDLSQVEARFCFMYTGDPELVRLANTRPSEYDQHSENAVIIGLARSVETARGAPRQTAKAVVHGAQRNMQAATLQDTMLKDASLDTDIITPSVEKCAELLEAYHRRYPAIRGVFFEETRRKLRAERKLVNSWGRVWELKYDELDDEAERRAFSFLLQSEAADLINRRGYERMHRWLREEGMQSRIMLHVHDELVFSCPTAEVHAVAQQFRDYIEEPVIINGEPLVVPCEFGLGRSWAIKDGGFEWNELPGEEEMLTVARSLV